MADENTKVQLVESDIPGAELPKPAECCTVATLKRWLSCRGAEVSGNRKDLIKRLDYEPCNVNYFEIIVTFAIEVNSLQTAVESNSAPSPVPRVFETISNTDANFLNLHINKATKTRGDKLNNFI